MTQHWKDNGELLNAKLSQFNTKKDEYLFTPNFQKYLIYQHVSRLMAIDEDMTEVEALMQARELNTYLYNNLVIPPLFK